jgi:hypothetical protein
MSDDSEDLWRAGVKAGDAYRVDGGRIWLSHDAREIARSNRMTDAEYAKYLMNKQRLGDEYEASTDIQHEPEV